MILIIYQVYIRCYIAMAVAMQRIITSAAIDKILIMPK